MPWPSEHKCPHGCGWLKYVDNHHWCISCPFDMVFDDTDTNSTGGWTQVTFGDKG